jgi:hypothetical protein
MTFPFPQLLENTFLTTVMPPLPISNLPSDWIDHGIPGLICTPAKWTSVILFFVANYLAHCATVKPYPAEPVKEIIFAMAAALFLPSFGITRAIDAIIRHSRFRKISELERAAIAGALCMVVRMKFWEPEIQDEIRNNAIDPRDLKVRDKIAFRLNIY